MLYLEAHEPLQKWAGQKKRQQKSLLKQVRQTAAKKGATVDWEKVDRILQRADGIPTADPGGQPGFAGTSRESAGIATSRAFLWPAGGRRVGRQRLGDFSRRLRQRADGATTVGDAQSSRSANPGAKS